MIGVENKEGENVGWVLDIESSQREMARRAHNLKVFLQAQAEMRDLMRRITEPKVQSTVDPRTPRV